MPACSLFFFFRSVLDAVGMEGLKSVLCRVLMCTYDWVRGWECKCRCLLFRSSKRSGKITTTKKKTAQWQPFGANSLIWAHTASASFCLSLEVYHLWRLLVKAKWLILLPHINSILKASGPIWLAFVNMRPRSNMKRKDIHPEKWGGGVG